MKPLICIAGKNEIAVRGLSYLVENYSDHEICFLPNSTDDGVDTWQPSLIRKAKELGVKRVTLEEIYKREELIFISLEFAELIKTRNFKSNRLYNIHFSKLPQYRGMYTSAHPILNGEIESGVTLHFIDDGVDTGEIIDQLIVKIDINDTARDLYIKYLNSAFTLFKKNIDNIVKGNCLSKPQDVINASYYSKKSIQYSAITFDFQKTAFEIHNQLRAFTFREYQMPVYLDWQIIYTCFTNQRSTQKPGTMLKETDEYFLVASIDYDIKLMKDYYSVLWKSCESGDISQYNQSIRFINDVNLKNKHGWNALIIATYSGHYKLVSMLIESGANINSTNYKGTTVLMYALSYFEKSHDDSVFNYLIKAGANISAIDSHGKKLSDYIKEKGFENRLLLAK
jgi:methionyl-tRNA formyltransferase